VILVIGHGERAAVCRLASFGRGRDGRNADLGAGASRRSLASRLCHRAPQSPKATVRSRRTSRPSSTNVRKSGLR